MRNHGERMLGYKYSIHCASKLEDVWLATFCQLKKGSAGVTHFPSLLPEPYAYKLRFHPTVNLHPSLQVLILHPLYYNRSIVFPTNIPLPDTR